MSQPDRTKAKAILGVVNHYLLHGDYPHLDKGDFNVVAQALLAFDAHHTGFNEFLGEVQHRLLKLGYMPPAWPDPKIRDQGDLGEAVDVCVQWCAARLDEAKALRPEGADTRTALLFARSALRRWTELYARLQNESGEVVSRKLDYNLPPADHVRALEAIDEALKGMQLPQHCLGENDGRKA